MRAFGQWLFAVLRENWVFLLVVGAIAAAFLVLRTPASSLGSVAEADSILQGGQPVLVEFYSNT
jgi:hypothetical protein